uniref:Uncharacterized protein n=1 Tax=Anguilla anguilla TaxID=7936 RepID=A0A0E9PC94_ANGAN
MLSRNSGRSSKSCPMKSAFPSERSTSDFSLRL